MGDSVLPITARAVLSLPRIFGPLWVSSAGPEDRGTWGPSLPAPLRPHAGDRSTSLSISAAKPREGAVVLLFPYRLRHCGQSGGSGVSNGEVIPGMMKEETSQDRGKRDRRWDAVTVRRPASRQL